MNRDLTLLTAVGSAWESDVVAAITETGSAHLVRRCADLADLLAAAQAGLARVAVVSADLRGLDRSVVVALREAGLAVLGVHAPGDDQQETFLRRIGVADVVAADAVGEEWLASLTAVPLDEPQLGAGGPGDPDPEVGLDPVPRAQGQVVAVWGPTGAPGRTFVATQLAGVLAEQGTRVVLVDADTYGASVAQVLALLDEAAGLAAAVRAANLGRLDVVTLASLAPEARPGLRVLTGLPQPERWPELEPDALVEVLTVAKELADVVLVDCAFGLEEDEDLSYDTRAPRRNGATLAVLEAADQVVAVGRADPVGLQRLVRGLAGLRERGITAHVVANQVRSAAVGAQPAAKVRDTLHRFAGVDVAECLPAEAETVDTAVLEGRLLVETSARSALLRALQSLAGVLVPVAAPPPSRPRRAVRG